MTVLPSGGKIVAFSAVRSSDVANVNGPGNAENETPQKPSETPMLLQVSMVTLVARPMSFDEFEVAMEFINQSKDTMKDLFKKGKDFYEKYRIGPAMKALEGLGNIISGVSKLLPEKEDPMVTRLAALESDIKNLSDKLNENFNEMKSFISEQSFYTNIMSPTSVLTRHMRDCIRIPGDDSKENFRRAYEATTPLVLQYVLSSYLMQATTNPLKINMNNEKVKTRATFEKWEDMISRVMAQFILLEAFAKGLLGSKNETSLNRLVNSSNEVLTEMDSWKKEYYKDQSYWEELKTFLEPYVVNNTKLNNSEMAAAIKTKLDNYLTSDAFYVCVFKESTWKTDYFYSCANEKDQIIGVWNKGKRCCFIYRSRQGGFANQEAYDSLRYKMLDNNNPYWSGTFEQTTQSQVVKKMDLPGNMFISFFFDRVDLQIQHSIAPATDLSESGYHTSFVMVDSYNKLNGVMTALIALP